MVMIHGVGFCVKGKFAYLGDFFLTMKDVKIMKGRDCIGIKELKK